MYKSGDVVHAPRPNTSIVDGRDLMCSRAPKDSRSECVEALWIVLDSETAPKYERSVEVSKGCVHVSFP